MFGERGSILSRPSVVLRATPRAARILDGSRARLPATLLPSIRVRASVALAQLDRLNTGFTQPSAALREPFSVIGALNAQDITTWRPCRMLRPRSCVKASGSQRSAGPFEDVFFNRALEVQYLENIFDMPPYKIWVLVGPRNSGKTRLLQELKGLRAAAQATKGEGPPPVLYIDCRRKDISSPLLFSTNLRKLVTEDVVVGKWWESVPTLIQASTIKSPLIQTDLKKVFQAEPTESPIDRIIDSLTAFLEATRPLRYKPVIIIDEANVLMEWTEQDKGHRELKKLLRFFVRVTKQEKLAHIVLATSDYFLINWLQGEGLDSFQFGVDVIGDLPNESEAKKFVGELMKSGRAPQSLIEIGVNGQQVDMWPEVYEICGGNIGLLVQCAQGAKVGGSWKVSLDTIIEGVKSGAENGLKPKRDTFKGSRSPPAWTSDQCKTVYRKIARSKHHAVSRDVLEDDIGETALLSMLEWNLVAFRPKSVLANDVKAEVFAEEGSPLITMPSPVHLYLVKQLDRSGKLEEEVAG